MREPDYVVFHNTILRHRPALVSAATAVEFLIVASGKGDGAYQAAIDMLGGQEIVIVPVDHEQALIAGEAHRRYGRGRPPVALNLGDTFAYALASIRDLPLLFKGNDFAQTDVTPAV